MSRRFLLRIAISLIAAVAVHASAQSMPESFTDADIAGLQQSIEAGCVKRGLERQDPEKSVRGFCACVTAVMKDKVSREAWQRGLAAAANGDNDVLMAELKSHLADAEVCKGKQQ